VFWKEVADAKQRGDDSGVRRLYDIVRRALYVSAAAVSCLLIPYSDVILAWTVGPGFRNAQLCLALMFLYPIHQALGQVQGTFYLAVGATRAHSVMGLSFMLASIPATYFMLAPPNAAVPGLGMGSVGLALKLVVMQILGISVQMIFVARRYGIPYDFGFQAGVLCGFLALGWITKFAAAGLVYLFMPFRVSALWTVSTGAVMYVSILFAILHWKPELAGLSREQLPLRWIERMSPFRVREAGHDAH
jgi:hypothetical protein